MRRTVNVSFNPWPRRPMTTPEKTWMRSLSPSTTLVWTFTESPTPKAMGFLRYCSDSILSSNAWFIKSLSGAFTAALFFLQQIRPAFCGPQPRLFGPPFRDLRMVAREQHIGDFHPAKLCRPRVMRILQQIFAERLVQRTFVITQNPGQQPRHRVNDDHRRQRAIRQHVIADGQFIVRQTLADPLIESFITAADQQQMLELRQFAGNALIELPPRRRKQNHARLFVRQIFNSFKDRLRLQQHPRPAAERTVIHRLVAV